MALIPLIFFGLDFESKINGLQVSLLTALPLTTHRMRQRRNNHHPELIAIADAAVVFAPSHFVCVGREILAADVVMDTGLSATQAAKDALSYIGAG
jgi:hypothetical protein